MLIIYCTNDSNNNDNNTDDTQFAWWFRFRCGSEASCWFILISGSVFIDGALFHPPNWSVSVLFVAIML